ncbi:NADH-cytochrome b-5 reductase [Ophiocordyceps camponoti-floridani]|uniref:NADH-cytochrome b-5 reductase n=1 Tax=Ophiocordyceps camponoti-floridani TaxID=2030778 RepID=A0A8H4VCS5_9HYPO|nr:NADH-cytochrome b-5 reductase [Ophiocordyceps camponoti-floridani]
MTAQALVAKPTFRTGPSFVRLRLHSSEATSPTTKMLRFQLNSPNDVSGLGLGGERGFLDLCVKKYPGGKMSTHLHSLSPGDTLLFPVGIPGYKWKANSHAQIVLIAGGQGITPIFTLARGVLENPDDRTRIHLIYGVRDESEILFRERFNLWQRSFPDRFQISYVLSNPGPDSSHQGTRIDAGVLASLLAESAGQQSTRVFVSGPPAMEKSLLGGNWWTGGGGGALAQLGYESSQVYKF